MTLDYWPYHYSSCGCKDVQKDCIPGALQGKKMRGPLIMKAMTL